MNKQGLLVVVSGFSGAGKGTAMKRLLEKYNTYALSVSATTRAPREGEQDGREYFFKTVQMFEEMIANDELVEYAQYVANYYGTPKAYVEEQLAAGKNVILEIEIQGALKIKQKFPDAVLLFVVPPSAAVLRERLIGRGTENLDVIEARLKRAAEEAEGVEAYDYIVVNDNLEDCVEDINEIIKSEQKRVAKNLTLINNIKDELCGRRMNMIHPSYTEIMKVVNEDVEPGEQPIVQSRYSIVLATAKRARQIIDGDEPMAAASNGKPLSTAVEEVFEGKVKIVSEEE